MHSDVRDLYESAVGVPNSLWSLMPNEGQSNRPYLTTHALVEVNSTDTEFAGIGGASTLRYRKNGELLVRVRAPRMATPVEAQELAADMIAPLSYQDLTNARTLQAGMTNLQEVDNYFEVQVRVPFYGFDTQAFGEDDLSAGPTSMEAAHLAVRDRFASQIEVALGVPVVYENTPDVARANTEWVRLMVSTEDPMTPVLGEDVYQNKGWGMAYAHDSYADATHPKRP